MQHDANATDATVSAEESAILGRFAERASEAANVPANDDGAYVAFLALILI
jgi:hypothetical protein